MMREITPLLSAGCKLSFKCLKYKEASEDYTRNSSCLNYWCFRNTPIIYHRHIFIRRISNVKHCFEVLSFQLAQQRLVPLTFPVNRWELICIDCISRYVNKQLMR